ncbi:spermidine/spermine N(1)-acetyltransferase-like protein 1 [Sagmatias obliquidens]|uniref:spermidine/spermine N(1)-acetyltransferase-like protein 1 n=1 Tax=Sagmatias obliquidens TaxID=3371155 RepID=UPI000F4433CE|nr:spermidine/spermine N(1)-acetyltransferase-like protein 1 [Lagenorhynchus obliquidens]
MPKPINHESARHEETMPEPIQHKSTRPEPIRHKTKSHEPNRQETIKHEATKHEFFLNVLRGGFGDHPLFYCLIAEVHNHQKPLGKVTVGFAMYYFTYDPWIGKLLYLEDFYVIQAYRGQVTLIVLLIL